MHFVRNFARTGACAAMMLALMSGMMADEVQAGSKETRLAERVQMHRNAPRGLEFVATSDPDAPAGTGKSKINVDVAYTIQLDGVPLDNAYANVVPIDSNKNGVFEFIHYNGYNFAQSYNSSGRRVWRVENKGGRLHARSAAIHRDSWAVLDLDQNGFDDVLHCWAEGSQKVLIARNGATGAEIRRVRLDDKATSPGSLCHISAYRMQPTGKPLILVAHTQVGGNAKCGNRNWVDNWSRVVAFDTELNQLWQVNTCDAGHQTAGVDADGDGLMEYVFAGKYALDPNGKIRCSLKGWNSSDHVDAIRIAKLDPAKPDLQALAVGRTGGGAFSASSCKWLWGIPKTVKNPQELAVAQFDPAPKPLSVMLTQRGSETAPKTYVLNASGKLVRTIDRRIMPMQNAELDGNRQNDEIVAMFGEFFDGQGNQLLSRGWYWNLKGTKVKEVSSTNNYDKWVAFPLLFDVDSDGKDELVTWGQSLIVVGKPR